MDSSPGEADLVKRAVAGDTQALTAMLASSRSRLRARLATRIPPVLRGQLDADDVVQQAHIEAFRHIHRFKPRGPDAFYRWVHTIALRVLRNAIRAQNAVKRGGGNIPVAGVPSAIWWMDGRDRRRIEDSFIAVLNWVRGPARTPSWLAVRAEAVEAVQDAVAALPQDYQRALHLVHIEECPVTVAAAIMGRTERAVHNLCYKARKQLRELLKSRRRFPDSSR